MILRQNYMHPLYLIPAFLAGCTFTAYQCKQNPVLLEYEPNETAQKMALLAIAQASQVVQRVIAELSKPTK